MDTQIIPLPASVQEIADLIGREPALAIARHARHRCVYIPKRPSPDHWLPRLIGHELFSKLQRMYGGDRFLPARCAAVDRAERNTSIRRAYEAGDSIAAIATRYDLTARMVEIIVDPDFERKRAQRAAKSKQAIAYRRGEQTGQELNPERKAMRSTQSHHL